jgi:hypothetical protein
MGIALGLLILFFAGKAIGRLPWSRYLGWVAYQILLMRGRVNAQRPAKGFYVDKTGFYKVPHDDD